LAIEEAKAFNLAGLSGEGTLLTAAYTPEFDAGFREKGH
jgi:hypothetical protein